MFTIFPFLVSCTNSDPVVTALTSDAAPVIKIQSSEYADTHLMGSQNLKTADLYSARIKIHSGQAANHLQTSDGYQMTVRGVSF